MDHEYEESDNRSNTVLGVFVGLLVGGLAGATAMLLFAPQSGKKTRKQIEDKSIELRGLTTDLVEDTVSQVRSKANKFMTTGRKSLKEFKHQGQEMAIEQLDHVSAAVKAGKNAIHNS
ncbi:MAG: YtxH domain-containing protein [Anaerolineales bacterium]|jgi:gas vesicle protein|nr:YtxH domain-containing protein [Anaerolineales bacterium]